MLIEPGGGAEGAPLAAMVVPHRQASTLVRRGCGDREESTVLVPEQPAGARAIMILAHLRIVVRPEAEVRVVSFVIQTGDRSRSLEHRLGARLEQGFGAARDGGTAAQSGARPEILAEMARRDPGLWSKPAHQNQPSDQIGMNVAGSAIGKIAWCDRPV